MEKAMAERKDHRTECKKKDRDIQQIYKLSRRGNEVGRIVKKNMGGFYDD
jgi:hypothetical protein